MTEQNVKIEGTDTVNEEAVFEFELKNNVGTVMSNDIEVFKILYADREKINRFREITFNENEINYHPVIVNYRESSLAKEIFKKIKDAILSFNNESENNLDVAQE